MLTRFCDYASQAPLCSGIQGFHKNIFNISLLSRRINATKFPGGRPRRGGASSTFPITPTVRRSRRDCLPVPPVLPPSPLASSPSPQCCLRPPSHPPRPPSAASIPPRIPPRADLSQLRSPEPLTAGRHCIKKKNTFLHD